MWKTVTVRKLTSGKKEKSFAWEDGEHLFFVGNREKDRKGEALLYRISVAGGEAELCGDPSQGHQKDPVPERDPVLPGP